MGLFDDLTVEHPLPDGFDPTGISFQTKDTAEQYLVRYFLREDGSLFNTRTQAAEEHHGALDFYASNWAGSYGDLMMTSDDLPPWHADYTALYDHGKLLKIEGPGKRPNVTAKHVLQADFRQACEERRVEGKTPERLALDALHTEWVHWISGIGQPTEIFEAVKPPALAVRLHHLWSNCAWGWSQKDDFVRDLRQWSEWLAAQDGLNEENRDLLARTAAILEAGDSPERR